MPPSSFDLGINYFLSILLNCCKDGHAILLPIDLPRKTNFVELSVHIVIINP
jgi:hypothetical protein